MNEITQTLLDGLVQLEEVVGATITWAGGEYRCVGGSELRGKRLDLGGFQFHSDTVAVVRSDLFAGGARPAAKQTILYRSVPEAAGITWRIDAVRTLHEAILVLECNDVKQAA